MGAHLLRLLPIVILALSVITPAAAQQLCLNCHPTHYSERGGCTSCHRGNPASNRKNIAHARLIAGRYASFTLGETDQVRAGMRLIELYACRRCHVVANRGNRLAASLDLAPSRKAPPELVKSIMQPVAGMPDFRLDERQQTAIINALQWAVVIQKPKNTIQPQIVHFSTSAAPDRDLFSRKCGPCHRILSLRHGVLGQGDIGPNLSGLLSPLYPQGSCSKNRWTEARLASWLKNPRRKSPWAMMQPVELTKDELAELVSIMLHADRGSM